MPRLVLPLVIPRLLALVFARLEIFRIVFITVIIVFESFCGWFVPLTLYAKSLGPPGCGFTRGLALAAVGAPIFIFLADILFHVSIVLLLRP